MEKSLDQKLAELRQNRNSPAFILADAKDADMAFGIRSPGTTPDGKPRSIEDFRDQIREMIRQGLVDIMLMSASTSEVLTIRERLFDSSPITPAARANDATDVHVVRGGIYPRAWSRPFASTTIDHIQAGKSPCTAAERKTGANLGLYSVTFNNNAEADLATMQAYKEFRLEAEAKGFRHFLEVFEPNVAAEDHGLASEEIPAFVNDHIVHLLAGVPAGSRPLFLKIPYLGAAAMEELCGYDASVVVGVLGGSSGTTHDAFHLVSEAKKHGARAALFGRKIKAAEHQLSFVEHLRLVADDHMSASDAVKSYHAALCRLGISPRRTLNEDLQLTEVRS